MMRSSINRVCSIEPDGMKNERMRKVLINKDKTRAEATTTSKSMKNVTKIFLRNLFHPFWGGLPWSAWRPALRSRRPSGAGLSKDPKSTIIQKFFLLLYVVALFFDLCLLAAKIAKEVKLGTANVATGNNFDVVKNW